MDIRRALIVDDSKLVCFKLRKILEEKGISSQEVYSGEDALSYLNANPIPDVMFVDIMMPGMDGYQTIDAIRAQPALVNLPVIMCSSNDNEADRAKAKQHGANGFLSKPPLPEQLFQALANLAETVPSDSVAAVTTAPEISAAVATQPPTPVTKPVPSASTTPAATLDINAELTNRLTREAVKAAEQAINAKMEDLTHRLALEAEETARRVTNTLATETARNVAQRTATETATQLTEKNIRQVATQVSGEVTRSLISELVPNLVTERVKATASTTINMLSEQAIQDTAKRLVPEILQQISAAATENALRVAHPKILSESSQLRENLRNELTREMSDKLTNTITMFIESEGFRTSITKAVRSTTETVAEQIARATAETTTRAAFERNLARSNSEPSPIEQIARDALSQVEKLKSQMRTSTLGLGVGLIIIVLYLAAKMFM